MVEKPTFPDIGSLERYIRETGLRNIILPFTAALLTYKPGQTSSFLNNFLRTHARSEGIFGIDARNNGTVEPVDITIDKIR